MPKIKFITHSGEEFVVEADAGMSVMEAATSNDVPGIEGDCGGCCSCATCHVFVEDEWRSTVGEPVDMENDMLEFSEDRKERSRLCCQIEVRQEIDGLTVRIPEFQN